MLHGQRVIGQIVSGIMVIVYFMRFRKMELDASMLRPQLHLLKKIFSLGMASCINQIAMAVVQITMNNTLRYYGAASYMEQIFLLHVSESYPRSIWFLWQSPSVYHRAVSRYGDLIMVQGRTTE